MHCEVITNLDSHPDKELDAFLHNEGKFSSIEKLARYPNATQNGGAGIIIKLRLPNGSLAFARITQALYLAAGDAFKGAQERTDYIATHGKEPPTCSALLRQVTGDAPKPCEICKDGPCQFVPNAKP